MKEKTLKQETQEAIYRLKSYIFRKTFLKPSKCPYDYLEVNESMFRSSSKGLMIK